MHLEQVKTIADLNIYLYHHPSPLVAEILRKAIDFFAQECRNENGKMDWSEVKKRHKMGLRFKLDDDTPMDAQVASALRAWVLRPGYGRELGTSFADAMMSHVTGSGINPREEVHRILSFFIVMRL